MNQSIKDCILHDIWFKFFSIATVGLLIASFIVPPTGVISSSVLAGVGELFAFSALGTVIKAIDKGVDAKVEHNNTKLTVGDINKGDES